mmetsp:Transcript_35750/g.55800  ORF Transcript_35750/g.55800 Transcript_35750/m.55800 type:complete len:140 (+) Transcript_35750:409-828(+)
MAASEGMCVSCWAATEAIVAHTAQVAGAPLLGTPVQCVLQWPRLFLTFLAILHSRSLVDMFVHHGICCRFVCASSTTYFIDPLAGQSRAVQKFLVYNLHCFADWANLTTSLQPVALAHLFVHVGTSFSVIGNTHSYCSI